MKERSVLSLVLLVAAAAVVAAAGSTEWYRWETTFPASAGSPLISSLRYRATLSLYRLCEARDYPPASGQADADGCEMVGPSDCPSLQVPFTADGELPFGDCSLFQAARVASIAAVVLLVASAVSLSCGHAFLSLSLTFLGAASAVAAGVTFYEWTPACELGVDGARVSCTFLWSSFLLGGGALLAVVGVPVGMHAACHPPTEGTTTRPSSSDGGAVGARKTRDIWFD